MASVTINASQILQVGKLDILGNNDSGSNVFLVKSKLERLKGEETNIHSITKLLIINGVKKPKGLTKIKIKIFNIF